MMWGAAAEVEKSLLLELGWFPANHGWMNHQVNKRIGRAIEFTLREAIIYESGREADKKEALINQN